MQGGRSKCKCKIAGSMYAAQKIKGKIQITNTQDIVITIPIKST